MQCCIILIFCILASGFQILPRKSSFSCGYQSCHPLKKGFINVHLVCHTHDDVGWLKTVDQYYSGSNMSIQDASVREILDSVTYYLKENSDRRFIYVETAFLWKWWSEQNKKVKNQFRKLIENGQLEIVGGGWSMNDEATTYYQSIIDQFSYGMRILNETFGRCAIPKVGWQIDPFGHSREMASIFAQLGFDCIFLGRIDYQDKKQRINSKEMEFVWKGSSGNNSIFTSILYNLYSPPRGLCFDILCDDEPIYDDISSPYYNLQEKLNAFFNYTKGMMKAYRSSNLLVTMGGDFHYQNASQWFENLDKLIKYANQMWQLGSPFNVLYSTPSCYLKAVNEESSETGIKWPEETYDFFPYADSPHSYWTGFYCSRPSLKFCERLGNNFLQVIANLDSHYEQDLNVLRDAVGILQHHDAITGTEKQHVAEDYSKRLFEGFGNCEIVTSAALRKLKASSLHFRSCLLTNISQCSFTEQEKDFFVTVYNPLSRFVNFYVRLPVVSSNYLVIDPSGHYLSVDLIPISKTILEIPGRNSSATYDLLFLAEQIPPLGFKSFYVSRTSNGNKLQAIHYKNRLKQDGLQRTPFKVKLIYEKENGLVTGLKMNEINVPFSQKFMYYHGQKAKNNTDRPSGAYVFRPKGSDAIPISDKVMMTVHNGQYVKELRQIFSDWISQIIRIYRGENYVEFEWLVGPIPEGEYGKEVITRYLTNLNSASTFYTDSNGRSLMKRTLNYRPTWKLDLTEEVSGNYYPVTSKVLIRDANKNLEFAVLTDRAQGASSLIDGQLELMVHRCCVDDDSLGVHEPLLEKAYGKGLVVKGSHYVVAGSYKKTKGNKTLAAIEKDIVQRKLLSAWTFLSPTGDLSFEKSRKQKILEYSGLTRALPENINILTLEPWTDRKILLRLEHIFEKDEDSMLSQPVTVDLSDLFTSFKIITLRETTLGANEWLNEAERLKFETEAKSMSKRRITKSQRKHHSRTILNFKKIELQPMQIRTFIAEIKSITH